MTPSRAFPAAVASVSFRGEPEGGLKLRVELDQKPFRPIGFAIPANGATTSETVSITL
jgi:hypothetical protein